MKNNEKSVENCENIDKSQENKDEKFDKDQKNIENISDKNTEKIVKNKLENKKNTKNNSEKIEISKENSENNEINKENTSKVSENSEIDKLPNFQEIIFENIRKIHTEPSILQKVNSSEIQENLFKTDQFDEKYEEIKGNTIINLNNIKITEISNDYNENFREAQCKITYLTEGAQYDSKNLDFCNIPIRNCITEIENNLPETTNENLDGNTPENILPIQNMEESNINENSIQNNRKMKRILEFSVFRDFIFMFILQSVFILSAYYTGITILKTETSKIYDWLLIMSVAEITVFILADLCYIFITGMIAHWINFIRKECLKKIIAILIPNEILEVVNEYSTRY